MENLRYNLFLGAGCSKAFDFPLTHEFVTSFEEENKLKRSLKNELDGARKKIKKNNFFYDVESLLDYLQGYSNPRYYMETGGPFRSSLCVVQPIKNLKIRKTSKKLKDMLEEHMINQCFKEGAVLRALVLQIYDRLLSKVSGIQNWQYSKPDWKQSIYEIFTTNYDNSLDTYATLTGQSFTRGYKVDADNQVMFEHGRFEDNQNKLKIYKLHGSIEFHKLDSGKIIYQYPPSFPGRKINGEIINSKVMVYGIDKNVLVEPYLDLLIRMKRSLSKSKKCTVIGYSFRDQWIKQIFEEIANSKDTSEFTIELISPTATKDSKNLPNLQKNIVPIDKTVQEYLELEN